MTGVRCELFSQQRVAEARCWSAVLQGDKICERGKKGIIVSKDLLHNFTVLFASAFSYDTKAKMMSWVIWLFFVGFVWYLLAKKGGAREKTKDDARNKDEEQKALHIRVSIEGGREHSIDTGKVTEVSSGVFCLNPKSPFPLRFRGLTLPMAEELKRLLEEEAQWQRHLGEIAYLIARHNIECIELEEFLRKIRTQLFEIIERRKHASQEWKQSSEKDKEDLMKEFQKDALETIPVRPSNHIALGFLVFNAPPNITIDDELLALFSGNAELYRFYLSNVERAHKAIRVPADHYHRERWEALVELGLARRGKEIPINLLLESLRLKDINEYFADRLDKKLTRKAKAVEFAVSQPDVLEVLSKHISFREMFQIIKPPGIDVSSIARCYEYAFAQAELIRDTYVTGHRTLKAIQEAQELECKAWEIWADHCCSSCLELHGRKTKRIPSKLPPFHIGCNCSIRGIL